MIITPTQASYDIGDVVTISEDLGFVSGQTIELYLYDGVTYSIMITSGTVAGNNTMTFTGVVIPAVISPGADRYFVMRETVSQGEAFSDAFTLLAAVGRQQQRLGLGLGLGL